MPTGRQGQGQGRHDGGAAGAMPGARDQIRDIGHHLQEGAQQMGRRAQEGYDTAREAATHGYRQAEGAIARNPAPSVLVSFGVGFGLGLLLTVLVAQREETWYERYVPDPLRHLPDSFRNLQDAIAHLPDAISRRMPDALRR
jgi:ElaB/YqjD/DUF883 family membrane-anchored ribosome-binding protein